MVLDGALTAHRVPSAVESEQVFLLPDQSLQPLRLEEMPS